MYVCTSVLPIFTWYPFPTMREKEKKGLVPGVTFSLYHYTENFSCVLKNSRPKVEAEAPETALPLRH